MKLSEAVLELYRRNPVELIDPALFCDIDGMGTAKAAQLAAALEFARRRMNPSVKTDQTPPPMPFRCFFITLHCRKEHFLTISLNGAHDVIAVQGGIHRFAQPHYRPPP